MDETGTASIADKLRESDEKKDAYRKLPGFLGTLCRFLAIGLPVYSFLFIVDLLSPVGLFIYEGTHNAIFLAVVLTMVFLMVPASKSAPRNRVPWYDFIFIALSLAGVLYVAVFYEQLLALAGSRVTLTQQILGLLTIFVLLEAVRRTMGWMLIIVALFFLIHAKFTYLFPYPFHGATFSLARVMGYIYLPNQGIFGMILGIAASMVVSFLTFGAFLEVSGAVVIKSGEGLGRGFEAEAIVFDDGEGVSVGRCVWTDAHGDRVFSRLKGEPLQAGRRLAGTITGGTGRYAGLEGEYAFTWQYVLPGEDGAIQGRTGRLQGRVRGTGTTP